MNDLADAGAMQHAMVAEESPRPFGLGQRPTSVSFSLPPLPVHSSLLNPSAQPDRASFTPSLSTEMAMAQAGVDTTGMTPRTAFAALMEAVHVLKKEKPGMPSLFSPSLTSPALASPFLGSASPTGAFGITNPWSLSVPMLPTSPRQSVEQDTVKKINEIISIPWNTLEQMQRPPRDMKRFEMNESYVVCKALKWGQNTALLVRRLSNPTKDFGMYKPPAPYANHEFKVGDRLRLISVGYSGSRNRIATQIHIESIDGQTVEVEPNAEADESNGKGSKKSETSKRKRTTSSRKAEPAPPPAANTSAKATTNRSATIKPMAVSELSSGVIQRILDIAWPNNLGSRPPRDMKRLGEGRWYLVCKVAQRGDNPALFLRSVDEPEEDFGYYKPPSKYDKYGFVIGELVQLQSVGYSPGRNKIALEIYIDRKGVEFAANQGIESSSTPEIEIPQPVGLSPERGPDFGSFAEDPTKRLKLAEEQGFASSSS